MLLAFVGKRCHRLAEVSDHELLVTLGALGELYYASQHQQVAASVDALFRPVGEFLLQDVQVPRLTPCDGLPGAGVHGGITGARSISAEMR